MKPSQQISKQTKKCQFTKTQLKSVLGQSKNTCICTKNFSLFFVTNLINKLKVPIHRK